jgi:hypothetical protein
LDLFEFPWIPSSEMRFINGLHGKTGEILFARLFPGIKHAAGGAFGFSGGKRRITHDAKLTLVSDFLQSIVARAVPSSAASIKEITDLDLSAFSSRFAVETRQDGPSLH